MVEKRWYRSKAQGLVEFALIFPILIVILFAIIDFGWMVFNFSQLYNGLREGVRYGSVEGFGATDQIKDCAGILAQLQAQAGFAHLQSSNVHIWYDDGRSLPDSTPYATSEAYVVATCDTAGNWVYNTSYTPSSGTRTTNDYQNGDRVVVDIDVNVRFLTPFFSALATTGVEMHVRAARSIFPAGL